MKYEELKKKYNLPDYESLDNDFLIGEIDSEKYYLLKIKEKIAEKINAFLEILEPVFQPDTSIIHIYEYRYKDDANKEKTYQIFKVLVKYKRYSEEIAITHDEEQIANFIRSFFEDYQKLKKPLKEVIKNLRESWDIETSIEEDLSYLG